MSASRILVRPGDLLPAGLTIPADLCVCAIAVSGHKTKTGLMNKKSSFNGKRRKPYTMVAPRVKSLRCV